MDDEPAARSQRNSCWSTVSPATSLGGGGGNGGGRPRGDREGGRGADLSGGSVLGQVRDDLPQLQEDAGQVRCSRPIDGTYIPGMAYGKCGELRYVLVCILCTKHDTYEVSYDTCGTGSAAGFVCLHQLYVVT